VLGWSVLIIPKSRRSTVADIDERIHPTVGSGLLRPFGYLVGKFGQLRLAITRCCTADSPIGLAFWRCGQSTNGLRGWQRQGT
jgi:hypothetical protein